MFWLLLLLGAASASPTASPSPQVDQMRIDLLRCAPRTRAFWEGTTVSVKGRDHGTCRIDVGSETDGHAKSCRVPVKLGEAVITLSDGAKAALSFDESLCSALPDSDGSWRMPRERD